MYDSVLLGQTKFVKENVISFLTDYCDNISFLAKDCRNYDDKIINSPKFNFKYKKTCYSIDFWNMQGEIVTYTLTKELKNFLIKVCDLETPIITKHCCSLENLTLLKKGEIIFSCCSHEGYIFINENFKPKLEQFYKDTVKKDVLFDFVKTRYKQLKANNQFNLNEVVMLQQLPLYVAQGKNAVIYCCPQFPCAEDNYKQLVKKYMPEKYFAYFNLLSNFELFDFYLNNIPKEFYDICCYFSNIEELI